MNRHNGGPDWDVEHLLGDLETPATPDEAFRVALAQELGGRLAIRRGEAPLPPGWALCPFDRFCFAEQPLPRRARMHCPCSHAGSLLKLFTGGHGPVHARPCPARVMRAAIPGNV